MKPEDVTLAQAELLLNLPKELGKDGEGNPVTVSIGRFGPYVGCNKKFASIKGDQIFTITADVALALITEKANRPPSERKGRFKKKGG